MEKYILSAGDESVHKIFELMKPKPKKKRGKSTNTPDRSMSDLSRTFITAADEAQTKRRPSYFKNVMDE